MLTCNVKIAFQSDSLVTCSRNVLERCKCDYVIYNWCYESMSYFYRSFIIWNYQWCYRYVLLPKAILILIYLGKKILFFLQNYKICKGIGAFFWICAAFCTVGTVFVFMTVPETKGKSLADIQKILGG